MVCCFVPEVGENRFIVAALLAFFVAPLSMWLGYWFSLSDNGWSEPLIDLVTVVILVHLVPGVWQICLLVGVVCAQAPSLSVQIDSYKYYMLNFFILILGMSLAGYVHEVPGWYISIIVLIAVSPGLLFYANWQSNKSDELRAAAQAHESLKLIAGGVAHDFNNILTSVTGFSEIAVQRLDEKDLAYQPVQEVIAATNRAALLTRQLLSFSGRQVADKITLDLEEELQVISALVRASVVADFEIELVGEGKTLLVEADQGELQQVFLNILINAAEAPNNVSELTNAPSRIKVSVSYDRKTQQARVDVSDFGSGMSEQVLDKIFEPFYTTKPEGHGLGLAAVQRIVSAHGGKIEVESELNKGTQVSVFLPCTLGVQKKPPPIVEPLADMMLIIDDEMAIRSILRQYGEARFYDVIEASDGSQGIERFKHNEARIKIVLLDLKMPGLSGLDCIEKIREINQEIPILIISGLDGLASNVSQNERNVEFLAKPFRVTQLDAAFTLLFAEASKAAS